MPITEEIRHALDLERLTLPSDPRVLNIDVEEFVDWSGDDALWLWVTIAEETDIDNISGKSILELKSRIRDALRAVGVEEFAYISLAKPSELAEREAEE